MKLSEVQPGDVLIADAGFTCIEPGATLVVGEDLSVPCADGKHFLDGQVSFDDGDTLVGLTLAPST